MALSDRASALLRAVRLGACISSRPSPDGARETVAVPPGVDTRELDAALELARYVRLANTSDARVSVRWSLWVRVFPPAGAGADERAPS